MEEREVRRVQKHQLPLFTKYLPIIRICFLFTWIRIDKISSVLSLLSQKCLGFTLVCFPPPSFKMVPKNVAINAAHLYEDGSLPYLGINTVRRENVGVGTGQICTLGASDN